MKVTPLQNSGGGVTLRELDMQNVRCGPNLACWDSRRKEKGVENVTNSGRIVRNADDGLVISGDRVLSILLLFLDIVGSDEADCGCNRAV